MKAEKIRIYTVPNCGKCEAAKNYIMSLGRECDEIQVKDNFAALREMYRLSGSKQVPVIVVGGKVITGFDPEKIKTGITGQ